MFRPDLWSRLEAASAWLPCEPSKWAHGPEPAQSARLYTVQLWWLVAEMYKKFCLPSWCFSCIGAAPGDCVLVYLSMVGLWSRLWPLPPIAVSGHPPFFLDFFLRRAHPDSSTGYQDSRSSNPGRLMAMQPGSHPLNGCNQLQSD